MSEPELDECWMRRDLAMAERAAGQDEVPIGAVLIGPAGLVSENHNRTRELADPTAHAEILVLRKGGEVLGDWRLTGHTLYVTLEPCAMCAGALVLGRVSRLVFAAPDPKAGMCGSLGNLPQDGRLNHRVEITTGVLEKEASAQLRQFFRARR